jgi:hypothetical protein
MFKFLLFWFFTLTFQTDSLFALSYEEYLNSDSFYDRYNLKDSQKEKAVQPEPQPRIRRDRNDDDRDYRESRIELLNKQDNRRSYPIRLNRGEKEEREYEDIPPPTYRVQEEPPVDPYYRDRRAGRLVDRFGYSPRSSQRRKLYGFEAGMKLIAENYLLISESFPGFSIDREVEFYTSLSYMPYFRFRFDDIKINKQDRLYLGNMFEFNYMTFNQQSPKFNSNGSFYADGFVNIGTAIDIYSLYWRGDLLYKLSNFSFGGFIGVGTSYVTGMMLPFYFITHSEISTDDFDRYYGLGDMVVTAYEPISISELGVLGKYGLSLNLDVKQFHFGVGLSYGISKQSELFWITKIFYIEAGFKF